MKKRAQFLLAVAVFTLAPALFSLREISYLSQEIYVSASLRRAHSLTIQRIGSLRTAEDVPAGVFSQGPTGAEFAYVVQYDSVNNSLVVENIQLRNPHPFGFVFNVADPTRAPPSGTLFVSDLHGTAIGPLGIIRSVPGGSEVIGVGDMLDRGPSVENSLSLLGNWTLGDHDIWAIGAAIGNEHLLSLWLRMCYRNPPNQRLLKNLGIDLTAFEKFADNTYGNNEYGVSFSEALGNEIILKKQGPKKSVYEMAALNLHLKTSPSIQAEIRRIEEQAREGDSAAKANLTRLKQVLLPGKSGSLAELTQEERTILDDIKSQFLQSDKVHEFISTLLGNARIYQEYDFGDKKVLALHGIIPMTVSGDLAELGCYPSLTGRALLDKMQERLESLQSAYGQFISTGDENILDEFRIELSFWGDDVNSPLFPTQETRLRHSYLDGTEETENPAYSILKDPIKAKSLLEKLGVGMLILGHESNKGGRVVDVAGDGSILTIDGTFSQKGGEVGATETGAGLYIDGAGNIFDLHLLTIAEILAGKGDDYKEAKNIIQSRIRLSDLAYYGLTGISIKDIDSFPVAKGDFENLCEQKGTDYNDVLQRYSDKGVLNAVGDLLGVSENKLIYKELGSLYPTRFIFPAVVKPRSLNLADEGVEFNRTEQNLDGRPVEVGVLKIYNTQEGVGTAIVVNDRYNGQLYANRLQNVIEIAGAGSIPMNQMNDVRNDMQTVDEFIAEYENAHPGKEVIAAVPASNVLWNDWFVAYSEGTLYHNWKEPIYEREYSVFVVRKDGKASIENVKFQENDSGPRVINSEGTDITDETEYLTFGQQILKNSDARVITDISYQWDDLRHLIGFPEIRTPDKSLDYGGSYFLGKTELLQNRLEGGDLVNQALNEETILVSNVLSGLNDKHFRPFGKELTAQGLRDFLAKSGYREVSNPAGAGEYCYDESTDTIKIKFKRGWFSHTAIGITGNGEIVTVSVGASAKGGGATIEEVAEILKGQGAVNGILLCNGLDVAVDWQGERIFSAEEYLWPPIRERFSSVILFTRDRP